MRQTSLILPEAARDLFDHWVTARGANDLPVRRALDPVRLRQWMGDLSLMEVREGEKRFYIRLHGTRTSQNIGKNFSKQYMEDCTPPHAREAGVRPYVVSLEERKPVFSRAYPGLLTGCFQSFERLVLPMTANPTPEAPNPADVAFFLIWVGPTYLDPQDGEFIYGDNPPALDDPEEIERLTALSVLEPPAHIDATPASADPRPVRQAATRSYAMKCAMR